MTFFPRSLLLAAMSLCLAWHGQGQTTTSVTVLARLGGTPDGYDPQGSLIAGGDGNFYGTTEAGGPVNLGTVYRIAPDGTFATLYTFTGGSDGANPRAALLDGGDGSFYGTTSSGGNGNGTVFKITPAGAFTGLYSFSALDTSLHNADGAAPQAALVSGGDGFFYGTAAGGGANGLGTIFRVTPGGTFNTVYTFSRSGGSVPKAALTPGGDGYLYGAAYSGGSADHGAIFRVTPAGVYQAIYSFTGGTDGAAPPSALVLSGGTFYGLTQSTFFSVTPAGVLTPLYTFNTPQGKGTFGGLVAGPGGNFYGTALRDSPDGTGNLFQLTPAGAFTLLHKFDNAADGAGPAPAPVLDAAGNLYGVAETDGGGNDTGGGGGTVYQYTAAGAFAAIHDFVTGGSFCASALFQYPDGNFYGLTQQGGAKNGGTFFGVAPDGTAAIPLMEFDPDTQGSHPDAALVLAADGSLYGSLSANGPDGGGTIFQMVPGASAGSAAPMSSGGGFHTDFTLDPIHPFDPFGFILNLFCNTGEYPGPGDNATAVAVAAEGPVDETIYGAIAPSALVLAVNGTMYGILQEGGGGSGGAIFSRVPGSAPTVIHSFGVTTGDGILPEGLTLGTDGNLYGTTYGGGTATQGTIFKLTQDGTYSVLYSFQGASDGAYLQAGLTAGSDGNLYGVTPTGYGTIFSITPGGTFTTLHTFASDDSEGQQPITKLLQASDGNLYGTTGDGVLFSISHGGQFTRLYRQGYNAATGVYNGSAGVSLEGSLAPLIQATDGNLYGTTTTGGTDNAGAVYKVVLNAPPTPTPSPTPTPTPTPSPMPTPAPALPVLTVAASVPVAHLDGKLPGTFTFNLSTAPAAKLVVKYTLKGSAVNGQDFDLLNGKVKIKRGHTGASVEIVPRGSLGSAASKAVKLVVTPQPAVFTVGNTTAAKVKIKP